MDGDGWKQSGTVVGGDVTMGIKTVAHVGSVFQCLAASFHSVLEGMWCVTSPAASVAGL